MTITFITPVSPDHEQYLSRAIKSVNAQTVPVKHLWSLDHERRGPAFVRNKLLTHVDTPYVSFLDADDWLDPQFAELTLARISEYRYVYTGWKTSQRVYYPPEHAWCGGTFHLVTAVVQTNIARAVGGFDETLPGMEDTDFYMKIIRMGHCGIPIDRPLVNYSPGGGRGQSLRDSGMLDKLKAEVNSRYGGYVMGCCGEQIELSKIPVGQRQPGDVQAMAMWRGNRTVLGRVTARTYPRMSYPRLTFVDPRDVAADPRNWQMVPEPKPEPVKIEVAKPEKPSGVRALTIEMLDAGYIYPAPVEEVTYPAYPESKVAVSPDFAKVASLGLMTQTRRPIFVKPVGAYPSYSDFWRMVQISGFGIVGPLEVKLNDPDAVYIFTGPEDLWDLSGAEAHTVFWQLEYADPQYAQQANRDTASELWASDSRIATALGYKFVLMGSSDILREKPGGRPPKQPYDVTMLGYMTPRRQAIKDQLSHLRWPEDYPGHSGDARARILNHTDTMLHIHQHEHKAFAPLRYAIAAAYSMNVMSEATGNHDPYEGRIAWFEYGDIGGMLKDGPHWKNGDVLHDYLCKENPFDKCVMEALK